MDRTELRAARERVKDRLKGYRDTQKEIKRIDNELTELEAEMIYPRSPNLDGMPHGGAGGDAFLRYMDRKDALTRDYYNAKAHLLDELDAIERAIQHLPEKQKTLVWYRYVEGMRWEDIAEAMAYSWKQVHNIHAAALDRLIPVFGSEREESIND